MKYAEWNDRGSLKISRETEVKQGRYGEKTEFSDGSGYGSGFFFFFLQTGAATAQKDSGTTPTCWIWNGLQNGSETAQQWATIVQLKVDMDPRYVRLPNSSGFSLGHQCCLTACVLGQYPSLHGSGKTDNRFATNDSSWFTSRVGTSQSGRGRCPFRWQVLSMGQLLRGSCGTPHNEF